MQFILLAGTNRDCYYELVCSAYTISGPDLNSVIMRWVKLRTSVNNYSEITIQTISLVHAGGRLTLPAKG